MRWRWSQSLRIDYGKTSIDKVSILFFRTILSWGEAFLFRLSANL